MSQNYEFSLDPVSVREVETDHRRIRTAIPAPGTAEIMHQIAKYECSDAISQPPLIWDRAEGYKIYDPWGNVWIDFSSTIFVANCGHAHPHMVAALKTQAERLLHAYNYPTKIRAEYVEKLIAFMPAHLEKVSLFSTGTEASERAIKLARLYGRKSDPERRTVIGWDGNFHGKTMGAQMAGGYHQQKDWIGYQDPHMAHLPFPYPWVLEERKISGADLFAEHMRDLESKGADLNDIVAFVLETYQGWAGVFYPDDYVKALRQWANERDVLLVFDECQAGFGRTGKLFGYEYYDVEADLVICGKGISGSVPLSAVLGRADIIDLDPVYTSTHGGHPMACAAGLANLEIFQNENLVAEAKRKEAIVGVEIEAWRQQTPRRVGRVLGRGLLWGVFLVDPATGILDPVFCDKVVERCMQKGVFHIRTGRGTLKLGPPLNIPDDALVEGLRVTGEALAEVAAESAPAMALSA
jgi:4-aminobutyrate aminotransferase / (S)-3-amino-2-methylpropionate transaminase / 5-aminovalerate transaminase